MANDNSINSRLNFSGRSLLLLVFFISGAVSLIFEVIWTRILLISIGATAIAVGAVLGAFMAGMAIGSFVAGRSFFTRRDPILTYALLEGWIGVYSLITPYLLRITASASPVIQFAFAVIVLLPATIAMGVSLPILSRAFGKGSKWKAFEVGRLYAANTAGAVAGPLLAVFRLFPALGLRHTLHIACAADILICGGLLLGIKLFRRGAQPVPAEPVDTSLKAESPGTLLLAAMAVSGAAAMVYEVAWARTLSLIFGSSVYGTTIMLSTFLLGLTLGSAAASAVLRWKRRSVSPSAPAWLLTGSAVGAYASLLVARQLPFLFLKLTNPAPGHELSQFITQFVVSVLLMLPATLCLGAMLPVTTSLSVRSAGTELGRQVSRLYTANLLGSAAGPVIAAGLLIGNFGIEPSLRAASVLALVTALILFIRKRKPRFSPAGVVIAAAAVLFILIIDPKGEPVTKGYGFYNDPGYKQYAPKQLREIVSAHRMLYYRDGPTATVCVHRIDRFLVLKINGKNEASSGSRDFETKLSLAHLPLLAAGAKKVAVIGLGSGMTTGAILCHPVERVDVFEIEPAVVEASRFFADLTGHPLQDPRLRLIMGDARSKLLTREDRYDLIVSEPSNLWISGVANLFTRDFFTAAASRLTEEGIFSQWLQIYSLREESVKSFLATFRSVFPHTLVFKFTDLIILGSRQPIRFDYKKLQQAFQQPRIRESLSNTQIRFPGDMLIRLSLDAKGTAAFSQDAPLNTDDNMLLELAAPMSLYINRMDAIAAEMETHSHAAIDLVTGYDSQAGVYLEIASAHFSAGEKEKAHRMILDSLKIEDSYHGRRMLGQWLLNEGCREEARQAFIKALSLAGNEQERDFVQGLLNSLGSKEKK